MVLLAFSLSHQVEKYGAYVGIACFFGLAVLSLLYFAQAREVRRLRAWAGTSPELAHELTDRVDALAAGLRRVQSQSAPAPRAMPAPVAAATNGAHKLKPEQVAALAFARAAGVPNPPHPPQATPPVPVPQPVAVAVQDAEPQVAPEPATAVEPVPAAGNGNGHGGIPAPATPAARRPATPAAAPLRATPPPRRPAPAPARRAPSGPPPRRETSTRSVVLTSLLGVVVLAALVFGGLKLFNGGGDSGTAAKSPQNSVVTPPAGTSDTGGGSKKAKPTPTPTRETTAVVVFNATGQGGLAADMKDRLINAGYADKNVGATNDPQSTSRPASVVLYKRGARAQANDVARVLAIESVKPIDAATQALAPAAEKTVVVEVGMDKSGN